MTLNEVIMNFSLEWKNSVNGERVITLSVFLLVKQIQDFADNCGYLRLL